MPRGAVLAALGVAVLALLAAGCGGSKPPGVASLGPSTTTTSSGAASPSHSATKGFADFVSCMQKHGIDAQLGQGGRGVSISGGPGSVNGAQLQRAQSACQKLLPGGGLPKLTPAQEAENTKELVALAACMRKHGYPAFPDPDSEGAFDFTGADGIEPNSSQFQQAMRSCQPGGKLPLRIAIRASAPAPGKAVTP